MRALRCATSSAKAAVTRSATSCVEMAQPAASRVAESASAKARAERKRFAGSRSSARRHTSSKPAGSASAVDGATMGALHTIIMVAASVSPRNSLPRVRNSHKMMPAQNTSARRSTVCPITCSGAMYCGLPLIMPGRDEAMRADARAMPKSVMRPTPSVPTSMLWGDTSRCTMRSEAPSSSVSSWAAWRPASASTSMRSPMRVFSSSERTFEVRTCVSVAPSM